MPGRRGCHTLNILVLFEYSDIAFATMRYRYAVVLAFNTVSRSPWKSVSSNFDEDSRFRETFAWLADRLTALDISPSEAALLTTCYRLDFTHTVFSDLLHGQGQRYDFLDIELRSQSSHSR